MLKLPASRFEIISKNLAHNVEQFRKILPQGLKMGAVLKANAYGHGLPEMTTLCKELTDFILIYDWQELKAVRAIYDGTVLVLGVIDPANLVDAIFLSPIFSVQSVPHLLQLEELGRSLNRQIEVHLAIDADFGREGILLSEIGLTIEKLRLSKHLKLTGVYAHLSSTTEKNGDEITTLQNKLLLKATEALTNAGFRDLSIHLHASGGSLLRQGTIKPATHVRLGLSLYGHWPSRFLRSLYPHITLKPVLRWISWISQIKILPKGSAIGYNRTFVTKHPTKVGIIPQGYGHGFPRNCSNRGQVLVNGKSCSILGVVSMNCIAVDLTQAGEVSLGDEVVLLGDQGELSISVEDLAEFDQTINYETLTRFAPSTPRVIR